MLTKSLNDIKAARVLGLAVQTLRNMRCTRRGPNYVKLGKRVVYRIEDLERYLEAHKIKTEEI